jgi:hypothetical protein
MRLNSRNLALIALAASAAAPVAAGARPLPADAQSSTGHDVGITCGKDYSRNSVSGDYCTPKASGSTSAVATPTTPPTVQVVTKHDSGFAWGEAGLGAGGTLALVAIAGGGAIAIRRRHESPVGQHRSAATG